VLLPAVMQADRTQIDALTERTIGCAVSVHRAFGPGLLESIYHNCMLVELKAEGLKVRTDRHIPLEYRGQRVGSLKFDILVEECLIVEVKAVEQLHAIHSAQVITYLKLTGCPAGLLMNFNATTLRAGLRRLDHPDLYLKKVTPGLGLDLKKGSCPGTTILT
jgi:GxxExxY protein